MIIYGLGLVTESIPNGMESIVEEASIDLRGLVAWELDTDPEERSIQNRNFMIGSTSTESA